LLDPPYAEGILDDILHRLQYSEVLADDAIIVAESDKDGIPTPVDGWNCKLYRYGKSYVTIMRPVNKEDDE
jgi:16S rRNA G966 N2-methylase RsmD